MKPSLIVPCYNEAENVALFQKRVIDVFADCGYEYEIIFVDDGSKDATFHNLKNIYENKKCPVKIVRLSRNFGKESAIYAGLTHATGDYISIIDADLQQQPETVLKMVSILEDNCEYDVVAAYQCRRKESKIFSFFKKCFYGIINRLADVEFKAHASDFRTFRRSVRNSILELKEYHRFSKGIFAWVGFNTCYIPYTPEKRIHGKSKWGFKRLTNYAVDGIIGYSVKPLRMATFFGILTAIAAILYLIAVVLEKLIWGIDIPGYATVIVLILFLGSMQLFCIGIIGEYVGRTFEQSKQRPIYIERDYFE